MSKKESLFDYRIASKIFTKDQLAAIGSAVVESTFCEEQVESLIWALAKLDESQGKHFTSGMQMQTRLDMLSTLGKPLLRSEVKKVALTGLIARLKESNTARNVVVHGKWQTNGVGVLKVLQEGPENHPPALVSKRKKNGLPETKTAAEIEKIALDIARLSFELERFSHSLA